MLKCKLARQPRFSVRSRMCCMPAGRFSFRPVSGSLRGYYCTVWRNIFGNRYANNTGTVGHTSFFGLSMVYIARASQDLKPLALREACFWPGQCSHPVPELAEDCSVPGQILGPAGATARHKSFRVRFEYAGQGQSSYEEGPAWARTIINIFERPMKK